jgi:dTDP-4-amino-4,6-dideoxygalactose transaminase
MYATSAIITIGAQPVLADIEGEAMTISPASLARSIGPRTGAIVATHLYGQLADMEGVLKVAGNIPVIEDCAQAHGAERNGKRAGTFGAIGCFSFYPTKNLGALGDGGALITADKRIAEKLRSLRQYGWKTKYHADSAFGRNSRLDEIQAAALRVKLGHLDSWNARRREIICRYRQAAGHALYVPNASRPDHSAHLCVVRSSRRAALCEALASERISSAIHYPVPDHHQVALRAILPSSISLPETEAAVAEILTIPCFPELTEAEVERVCNCLAGFARQGVAA